MAELSESELITEINSIDTQIANIRATLGSSGTGAVQYVDHSIGTVSIDGSQRLEGLIKLREFYQKLLEKIPKAITRDHGYNIEPLTGEDMTEFLGDD